MLIRSIMSAIVLQSCTAFSSQICMKRPLMSLMSTSIPRSAKEPSSSYNVICKREEDIELLGDLLGRVLDVGDVLLLKGDLGVGKTSLSRGIIRRKLGDVQMRVTSPSYLLDNVYDYFDTGEDETRKKIHHMDLYRLPTGCDLSMLGIPEIYSTSLCIIEWPQRMGENLPTSYISVSFSIQEDLTTRRVHVDLSHDRKNSKWNIFTTLLLELEKQESGQC